ncbi:shikimate dehydrogenase [uncultured Roseovarius sp.]|uniref:shikimate dehydrogenase n=1 Tax=Roseovarius sp. TaxID=1486281 RepID=UPI001D2A847E|nr:shikimate dehydrogenase [uncultured Roseovarius sp.]TNE37548.1 MAG: shikimate dehydrogenase [Sphingomonadales bacterium]
MGTVRRQDGQATTPRRGLLRLGLVGRGIALSRTPAMHESEASAQGLTCRYDLLDTDMEVSATLHDILDQTEAEGFAGLNVTYPYKQQVMPLLHELSDAARQVGAVNTVVFRDGRRFGHNTDFRGFADSFGAGLPDADLGAVLLIGAGGAGAAVGHALRGLGAGRILVHDTHIAAAEELAASLRVSGGHAEAVEDVLAASAKVAGLVNATPVGMAKLPGLPIPAAALETRHWVADIIYFPLETELLRRARAIGCPTLGGEGMAVLQAVRAFELFTGRPANAGRMCATFRSFDPEEAKARGEA